MSFARGAWDESKWTALRLPHQAELRRFVQREHSLGTDSFTQEETRAHLDNVIMMMDTGQAECEFEVTFALSEDRGTAPAIFIAPLVEGEVLHKSIAIFVASYTMAVWRAETDEETNETKYAHLARVNRWSEPNTKHRLRCRFSPRRSRVALRLDDGDTVMFQDVGLEMNTRIGIWGCHGASDFYELRICREPVLEWSARDPKLKQGQ